MSERQVILVADDDENDIVFLRTAFEDAGIRCELLNVTDGQHAIYYLSGHPPYNDRARYPLPLLLILDIKMPRLNGFDVLSWLQRQPDLRQLPVVVLSSSSEALDITRARELGAAHYYVKPNSYHLLTKLVNELKSRWLPPASERNSK